MELLNSEGLLLSVLWSIGYGIKHKTRIPNTYIPFILLAVASALKYLEDSLAVLIFGEAPTLSTAVWAVVYGIQYTFFACGGYEAVRAAKLSWQNRRKKEKKMDFKKKNSFLFLEAFLAATVEFSIVALIFGSGWFGTFSKLTDGWILGIYLVMNIDLLLKNRDEKEKITPTYIAMQCLLFVNVVSFTFASITTNRLFSIVGLAVSVLAVLIAGVLPFIVNAVKAKRAGNGHDGKEGDEAYWQEAWAKYRVKAMKLAPEKRLEYLAKFLAFKTVGDNVYNALDVDKPLIIGKNPEDGRQVAVTVAIAKERGAEYGVTAEQITAAEAYLKSLVG